MRSMPCSIASLAVIALSACGSPPPDASAETATASLTGYDSGIFCTDSTGVTTKVECGCPGAPCDDGNPDTRFDYCSSDGNTCLPGTTAMNEVCGNGVDDDCDLLVDAADPECSSVCASREDCYSSKDDDCDGLVNEADPDCIPAIDSGWITCGWYDPHPDGPWQYVWCNDWCVIAPSSQATLQPPDTTITQLVDGTGNALDDLTLSTSLTVSFTGMDDTGIAGFECSLDGGAFATCTSPTRYDFLPLGAHIFAVRAVDTTGLVDPTPATASVTVEAAPETTIAVALDGNGAQVPDGGSTRSRDISFQFTASDNGQIVRFECALDGAPPSSCTSPAVYRRVARATHTFRVRAVDDRGIVGPEASWTWTVR